MAVIDTGAISLNSVATQTASVRKTAFASSNVNAAGSVNGKIVAIVKAKATPNSNGSTTLNNFVTRKYVTSGLSSSGSVVSVSHKYKTVSADLIAEATLTAYYSDRDTLRELGDYLPRYYAEVTKVNAMVQTQANEVTQLQALLKDLFAQFYVNTGTYALDRWESIMDVDLSNRSTQARRDFVNSKLRGTGTVTRALIKAVVDAFYGCEVREVNGTYLIEIKLVGKRGVPNNIADIERAINDIIPAHLGITFEFTWLPWSEIDESGLIWNEADTFTWDDLETAFLV